MKFPSFYQPLRSIQNDSGRDYVDESDLARLFNMIIIDYQRFSVRFLVSVLCPPGYFSA